MSMLDIFEIERFAIHDGPGIRTTVFFQGCPLRCKWCANPESQTTGRHIMRLTDKCTGCGSCQQVCKESAVSPVDGRASVDRGKCRSCGKCADVCPNAAIKVSGRRITPEELWETVVRDREYYVESGGGITLSGGEALLQFDRMQPFLDKCLENGIPVAVETCGAVLVETMRRAVEKIDLFLFDLKTLDREKCRQYTGGELADILAAFTYLCNAAAGRVIARVPVIPEFNENEIPEILEYAKCNHLKEVHLLPYHTLGMVKYRQLGIPYPYPVRQPLPPEKLFPYQELGKLLGISVVIGG